MDKEHIIERIRKVMALAERGVAGEAASARNLLERMMRQYGITDDDLQANPVRRLYYTVEAINSPQFHLLAMCTTLVTFKNVDEVYRDHFREFNGHSQQLEATMEEHAEIAALFEHYTAGYERSVVNLKRLHDNEVFFLKEKISAIKKELNREAKELARRRKEQAQNRKTLFQAFLQKNGHLFRYYSRGLEQRNSRRSSITDAAWNQAEEVDENPNMLPAMRIGRGDA